MNDPGRPWHMKHPLIDLMLVLHRPIETAVGSGLSSRTAIGQEQTPTVRSITDWYVIARIDANSH